MLSPFRALFFVLPFVLIAGCIEGFLWLALAFNPRLPVALAIFLMPTGLLQTLVL
jgi:hypothetical protein